MSDVDMKSEGRVPFEVIRPDPSGTMRSLTSIGYSTEAAVADLIDNSIAAGATRIEINFHWAGAAGSYVRIADNGHGMSDSGLRRAMTIGASPERRTDRDLGRFGMGLKTASFSQARELTVASRRRPEEPWAIRAWDVDHVLQVGEWQMSTQASPGAAAALRASDTDIGTTVLWRGLTRLPAPGSSAADNQAQREFNNSVRSVDRHLGMVFSRYLTRPRNPVVIILNGQTVQPWDPFLSRHPHVYPLAAESPHDGVAVQGFVLPHRSRLTAEEWQKAGGPRGWLEQQGFYVYRNDRLIVAGGWLGLSMRRDDTHSLARIRVDVTSALDYEWAVDVRKSTAIPPAALRSSLRRIATATRDRAAAVVRHKGKVVRDRRTTSPDTTWRQVSQHGRISYQINRDHALVAELVRRAPESRSTLTALLSLLEDTLPVGLIRATPDSETATTTSETTPELVNTAREMLEALINQGCPPHTALERVLTMPSFNEHPDLRHALTGEQGPTG